MCSLLVFTFYKGSYVLDASSFEGYSRLNYFLLQEKIENAHQKNLVLIPIFSVHTMIDFHNLTQVPSMEGANNIS